MYFRRSACSQQCIFAKCSLQKYIFAKVNRTFHKCTATEARFAKVRSRGSAYYENLLRRCKRFLRYLVVCVIFCYFAVSVFCRLAICAFFCDVTVIILILALTHKRFSFAA